MNGYTVPNVTGSPPIVYQLTYHLISLINTLNRVSCSATVYLAQ